MTRRLTFIFSLGAALAFPAIASANCGTIQGSFSAVSYTHLTLPTIYSV